MFWLDAAELTGTTSFSASALGVEGLLLLPLFLPFFLLFFISVNWSYRAFLSTTFSTCFSSGLGALPSSICTARLFLTVMTFCSDSRFFFCSSSSSLSFSYSFFFIFLSFFFNNLLFWECKPRLSLVLM